MTAGFAVDQTIALSGQSRTLVVAGISADGKTLTVKGGTIAMVVNRTVTVGVARVGGDDIEVTGASAIFTGAFNLAPNSITRTDDTVSVVFSQSGGHIRITRSDGGSWLADGYVVGQAITVTGGGANNGTYHIFSLTASKLTLSENLAVNSTPVVKTISNSRWDTDLKFAIGQQITLTSGVLDPTPAPVIGGQSVSQFIGGQFVVTGISADGKTLFVSGSSLPAVQGVAATVNINSPLVVYGDTSQDATWYKGDLGNFGPKPVQHEDALAVTFGSVVKFGTTFGTIARTTGSWIDSGFVPEGIIAVDGVIIGTVSQISADGKTLTLFRSDLRTSTDKTSLWASLTNTAHNITQVSRLGQNTDFFVFPLANPYVDGNDVIDAHCLFAGIPAGQLPAVGLTVYGGRGDDAHHRQPGGRPPRRRLRQRHDPRPARRRPDLRRLGFNVDRDHACADDCAVPPATPRRRTSTRSSPATTCSTASARLDRDRRVRRLQRRDLRRPRRRWRRRWPARATPPNRRRSLPQQIQTTLRARVMVTASRRERRRRHDLRQRRRGRPDRRRRQRRHRRRRRHRDLIFGDERLARPQFATSATSATCASRPCRARRSTARRRRRPGRTFAQGTARRIREATRKDASSGHGRRYGATT